MLNLFSFHLISSHRNFSWKLLVASLCHRSLCHHISSQLISCLLRFFTSSPHPIWCLLSLSQLFSADHSCSHLFSCHLSFSHLFSSQLLLIFLRFSQLFSTLLSSPQLMSAHLTPSHLLFPLLTSSKLFSHLLSWSQLLSARHTSSQLFSAHSQIISALLWLKTCSKNGSRRHFCTASFYPENRFAHRNFYTQKLLHRKAYSHGRVISRFPALPADKQIAQLLRLPVIYLLVTPKNV